MSLLDDIVQMLSHQQDFSTERVLDIVLAKLRRHTMCEAGSIFIGRPAGDDTNELTAMALHNDAVQLQPAQFTIPVDMVSIAGYVASTGEILEIDDVYNLPVGAPYSFNNAFDEKNNYITRAMLAFPLTNFQGKVVGVVQLMNHITDIEDGHANYGPFPLNVVDEIKNVLTMLAVIVESVDLRNEIQRLRQYAA